MSRRRENDRGGHRFDPSRRDAFAAFEAFTEEIGEWWRPNPLFALTPHGDGHLRFEPGEGGRLVATLASGKEFEVSRVTEDQQSRRSARIVATCDP